MTDSSWTSLRIDVGRLLRRDNLAALKRRPSEQGDSIHLAETVTATGLSVSTASVPDGQKVDVGAELRSNLRGVDAHVSITSRWEGECRRCLETVSDEIDIETDISFLPDIEAHEVVEGDDGEAYPIDGDWVDLGEVVREELMLALPLSPLCSDDCEGADPERFPTIGDDSSSTPEDDEKPIDPRWAGLSALTFDED